MSNELNLEKFSTNEKINLAFYNSNLIKIIFDNFLIIDKYDKDTYKKLIKLIKISKRKKNKKKNKINDCKYYYYCYANTSTNNLIYDTLQDSIKNIITHLFIDHNSSDDDEYEKKNIFTQLIEYPQLKYLELEYHFIV